MYIKHNGNTIQYNYCTQKQTLINTVCPSTKKKLNVSMKRTNNQENKREQIEQSASAVNNKNILFT